MRSDPLFNLTADLRTLGGGRVWSLMTSLFGDLAQGDGDRIEGPVLSSIMAALNVKPEAARVALHRLRNDGWITSEKVGRISHHGLTVKGRAESAAASPRIYSQPDEGLESWQLVMLDALDATLKTVGYIQVQPRIFVGPQGADLPTGALVLKGQSTPDWFIQELTPKALLEDYTKLHTTLRALADALPDPETLSPLNIAVLRCLVVHNWRRLVLKHALPPRGLIDADSPNRKCHVIVADLLARFPRPSLKAIAQDHAAT